MYQLRLMLVLSKIFIGNNNSPSFKFKQKITDVTGAIGTKNVEIIEPLKYLSNFWRNLGMPLIVKLISF